MTSITAYRDQSGDQTLNIFRLDPHMPHIVDGPKLSDNSLLTQEVRLATPSGGTVELTAGLFASRMRQNNLPAPFSIHAHAPFGVVPIVAAVNNDIDISNDSFAVFGQATVHATTQLRLIAGGRFTTEKLEVDSTTATGAPGYSAESDVDNFSWRLGAQYEFNRDLIAYATVSRGYKGAQIALPPPNAAAGTQPTVIRPEIPTSYELGLKGSLAEGDVGFEVSGFYTDLKDFQGQQCVPVPTGGINCRPENISGLVSKGLEFSLYGRPAEHFSLNVGGIWNSATYPGDFTGQDGSVLGGEQLVSAPEWKFTASGEFSQPVGNMEAFLAADAIYKSRIRLAASTNPDAIYGGHVTLGGRLGIRGADGGWTASIFARNLTNNHEPVIRFLNFPDGTGGVGQILTVQSFRQVGLSLDMQF